MVTKNNKFKGKQTFHTTKLYRHAIHVEGKMQVMSIVIEIISKILYYEAMTLDSVELYCAGTTGPAWPSAFLY